MKKSMKIEISTVVEVPIEFLIEHHEFPSAVQIVFDDIINYLSIKHYEDAMKWSIRAKVGTDEFDPTSSEYKIYMHHLEQGRLCEELKWKYREVDTSTEG